MTRTPDPAHAAEEAAWWEEEKARSDHMGRLVQEMGGSINAGSPPVGEPVAEDAIAHMKSLPPDMAVQKAREWTGRTDITTPDEAIAAVRAALSGGDTGADDAR